MKFSVIIPVYNLEGYINRCLKSFVSQIYNPKDYELVIVNDGSKDKSLKVITDLINHHPDHNIRVHTKENGGLSSARNLGISKAAGDYIWFVDGDDWVPENSFVKLSQYLEEMPGLDILEFDYELAIESDQGLKFKYAGNPEAESMNVESGREFLEKHEYSLGVTVKIYARSFLLDSKCLFPEGKYSEDNLFSLQTLLIAKKYYKINEVYYFYYQRKNSITKTKTTAHLTKYYEDIFYNMTEMRKMTIDESPMIQNTISRMNSFFVLLMLLDLFKNKEFGLMRFFAKKIKKNNFYPLLNLEMNHINKNKFFILRMLLNSYLRIV